VPTARFTVAAALVLAIAAACGGAAAPTASTSTAGPTATAAATTAAALPTSAATASGADVTALCRDLENLTSLDYAFGKPFSIVQSLANDSKALTLQHVQDFAASAPPELETAADDLVGLWTDLAADPTSVSESDPRWAEATDSISAWRDANC